MDVAALGRRARFQSAQQRRRPKKKTGFSAGRQAGGNKHNDADGSSSDDFSFKSDEEDKPIQIGNRIISPIKPVLPRADDDYDDHSSSSNDDDDEAEVDRKSTGVRSSRRLQRRRRLKGNLEGGRQRSVAAAATTTATTTAVAKSLSCSPSPPTPSPNKKQVAAFNLFKSRKEPQKPSSPPSMHVDESSSSSSSEVEEGVEEKMNETSSKLKPRNLFGSTSRKEATEKPQEEQTTSDALEKNGQEIKDSAGNGTTTTTATAATTSRLFPFPLHPEIDEQSTSASEDDMVFSPPKKRGRPRKVSTTSTTIPKTRIFKTTTSPRRRRKRQKKIVWEASSSSSEEDNYVILESEDEDDENEKSLEANQKQQEEEEDNFSTGTPEKSGIGGTTATSVFFTPIKSSTIPQVFTYEQVSVDQFRSPDRNNNISISSGEEPQSPSAAAATAPGTSPRRSQRARVPTLDYWKNEKVVYGFDQETKAPVPKAVVRVTGNIVTSRQGPKPREPFDSTALRQTHEYAESETAVAWDVDQEERRQIRMSCPRVCVLCVL
jgi:hypothetical protein